MSTAAKSGWRVVAAGTTINLALGVLYAWSIFKGAIKSSIEKGGPDAFQWDLASINDPYALCCLTFAFAMIVAGKCQEICTAKACRACTNNSDALARGGSWGSPGRDGPKVGRGTLEKLDCNWLSLLPTHALVLTLVRAHAAADTDERHLLHDDLKCPVLYAMSMQQCARETI